MIRLRHWLAIGLVLAAFSSLGLQGAAAEEVPNTIALRKVNEIRYNLSINLLDKYAQQEIGLRIRRVSGGVSEIISLPSKVLGAQGRAAVVINQKLAPDDVLLFTLKNVVIYKMAIKDANVIDLNNPSPLESEPDSVAETATAAATTTATPTEIAPSRVNSPNDAALRQLSTSRYILTINLLDLYTGVEISIERVRKAGGKSESVLIARKILGNEGKASVVFNGKVKANDLFVMKSKNTVVYSYRVAPSAT